MKPDYKFYLCLTLIALLSKVAWGQQSSENGQFEVDFIKGCAPLEINLSSTPSPPPGPNESIQYRYGDDEEFTSATTFTYDAPGTYTIVQIIGAGGDRRDEIEIEVFEPKEVDFFLFNCRNNSVIVEIIDDYYDIYLIDYGDGSVPTTDREHTYVTPDAYTVSVTGVFDNAKNNCGSSEKKITTKNTLPIAQIETVEILNVHADTGQIKLEYNLDPNINYRIEMESDKGETSIIVVDELDETIVKNLNTKDNYYCFSIITIDLCSTTDISSESVCSINLEVTAEDGQNRLEWRSASANYNYEIVRNEQPLPFSGTGASNYTDTDVICNANYCYRIIGTKTVNGTNVQSISGALCVIATSDEIPASINNVTASIEGENVLLNWEEPEGFNVQHYIINRAEDGTNYELIDTVTDNIYTDSGLDTGKQQYCYKIGYIDTCGKWSAEGVVSCPVLLKGRQNTLGEAEIFWTNYKGWENNVGEYIVEVLDENSTTGKSFNAGLSTNFTIVFDEQTQVKLYRIKAVSADVSRRISYSNILRYIVPPEIFLPEAFTPNADGLNDEYVVQGKYINDFILQIFNRWGEMIFYSENAENGWDGKINGKEAPQGTYIYQYEMSDFAGQTFKKSGTFVLLR